MQRLKIEEPPAAPQVDVAVSALRHSHLVVLPTETVYGLAADAENRDAVQKLAAVKARDTDQPFTHHLASSADLTTLAAAPPARVQALLERVWPGPLTAILPGKSGGPDVGLRVPSHDEHRARSWATGDSATGDSATGDSTTGDSATGDSATGDSATGDSATGKNEKSTQPGLGLPGASSSTRKTTRGRITKREQTTAGDSDDDVIARQLREAAERETDPILKEKLWDEYKKYKRAQK